MILLTSVGAGNLELGMPVKAKIAMYVIAGIILITTLVLELRKSKHSKNSKSEVENHEKQSLSENGTC